MRLCEIEKTKENTYWVMVKDQLDSGAFARPLKKGWYLMIMYRQDKPDTITMYAFESLEKLKKSVHVDRLFNIDGAEDYDITNLESLMKKKMIKKVDNSQVE